MQTSKPRAPLTLDPCLAARILLKLDPVSAAIFADALRLAFNPDEPRDEQGRWTSGGPSAEPRAAAPTKRARSKSPPARPAVRSRAAGARTPLGKNTNCQRRPQGSRPSASGQSGSAAPKRVLTLDDECALLSKAAYGTGTLPSGWTAVCTITKPSGLQATLYYNSAKNQYVLAFKGTSQFEDWRPDFQQTYTLTQQYHEAVQLARDMSSLYGSALTFTGHSLGGGLASAAALETHRNAITFNAAGISPNTAIIYGWDLKAPNTNIRSYYIPGEVLTNVQKNIAGWIRLTRPGTQIPLPVPPGGKFKLHGMDSVLSAMGL